MYSFCNLYLFNTESMCIVYIGTQILPILLILHMRETNMKCIFLKIIKLFTSFYVCTMFSNGVYFHMNLRESDTASNFAVGRRLSKLVYFQHGTI